MIDENFQGVKMTHFKSYEVDLSKNPILQFQGGQHLPEWQFCLWITFIKHDPERSVLGGQLSPIYPQALT
jgi:hypothetical protein